MTIPKSFTPAIDQLALAAAVRTADVNGTILKFGESQAIPAADKPFAKLTIHIPVTVMDTADGDEFYRWYWMLSNSATFASGTFQNAMLELGDAAAIRGDADTAIATHLLHASMAAGEVIYTYGRLELDVGGTSPSITHGDCWAD